MAVGTPLTARRLGVRGAGFVTNRRLILMNPGAAPQWWTPDELAVKPPSRDGIKVRLPDGMTTRLSIGGGPERNLNFGEAVSGLVLQSPEVEGWSGTGRYLGGHGYSLVPGAGYALQISADGGFEIRSTDGTTVAAADSADVVEVDVSGPGEYTTGGGWIGGGFGLDGALRGAATAAILNALTTRRHVSTIVRVGTALSIAAFDTDVDRSRLQFRLSRATHAADRRRSTRQPAHADLVGNLERLQALHVAGVLTDAEFDEAKRRLLT